MTSCSNILFYRLSTGFLNDFLSRLQIQCRIRGSASSINSDMIRCLEAFHQKDLVLFLVLSAYTLLLKGFNCDGFLLELTDLRWSIIPKEKSFFQFSLMIFDEEVQNRTKIMQGCRIRITTVFTCTIDFILNTSKQCIIVWVAHV